MDKFKKRNQSHINTLLSHQFVVSLEEVETFSSNHRFQDDAATQHDTSIIPQHLCSWSHGKFSPNTFSYTSWKVYQNKPLNLYQSSVFMYDLNSKVKLQRYMGQVLQLLLIFWLSISS